MHAVLGSHPACQRLSADGRKTAANDLPIPRQNQAGAASRAPAWSVRRAELRRTTGGAC